jgi:hypothetical protein
MILSPEGSDKVRADLQCLGDLRPDGWEPGTTETGPNYFSSIVLNGKFPSLIPQEFVTAVGERIRRAVVHELQTLLAFSSSEKPPDELAPIEPSISIPSPGVDSRASREDDLS